MVVGLLQIDLHLPMALSLKDKRSIMKSLKDRLHGRFNVGASQIEANEKWQRASLGVVTVGPDSGIVEGCLRGVVAWIERDRAVEIIRVEQELW